MLRCETAIGDFCEVNGKPCDRSSCEDCDLIYIEDGSGD
jgi:hypothetical protein